MKTGTKLLIIGGVVIFFIAGIASLNDASQYETSNNTQEKQEQKEEDTYEYVSEGDLRSYEDKLVEELGVEVRDKPSIKSISEEDGELVVTFRASENLTSGMTRGGMLRDMKHIFRTSPEKYESVLAVAHLPLTDQYGNTEEQWVSKISLSRETMDKINWDNFFPEDFSGVAGRYLIHPTLQE